MTVIIKIIKLLIVGVLMIFYWPLNATFLWLQGHYRKWYKTDIISFIIATPLYYAFFIVVIVFSIPLEMLGENLHPPLGGFSGSGFR